MNVAEFIGGCQWTQRELRRTRVLIECDPYLPERSRERMLESIDRAATELGINIKQKGGWGCQRDTSK